MLFHSKEQTRAKTAVVEVIFPLRYPSLHLLCKNSEGTTSSNIKIKCAYLMSLFEIIGGKSLSLGLLYRCRMNLF